MGKIQVTPELLLAQSAEMEALGREYESLFSGVTGTLNQMNGWWSPLLAHNFVGKISSAQRSFSDVVNMLSTGATAAKNSATTFSSVDSELAQVINGKGSDVNVGTAGGAGSFGGGGSSGGRGSSRGFDTEAKWWDKIGHGVAAGAADFYEDIKSDVLDFAEDVHDGAKNLAEDIKVGAAKVVDWGKDTVNYWVDNYKEKGWVYKTIQTGKAVASIAGAAIATAGLWGLTAGTAGVATPLAVVGTVYNANTVANAGADLYNIWFGDIEKVGETNILKTTLETAGGAVGKALGDEELGETIGSVAYTAGSITSVVANVSGLAGKVIQTDGVSLEAAAGEVKDGIKGVWDIATNTQINSIFNIKQAIGYDLTLLGYTLPNLSQVGSIVNLFSNDIYGDLTTLSEGAAEIVEEIVEYTTGKAVKA